MTETAVDGGAVAELARRLAGAEPGGWTHAEVQALLDMGPAAEAARVVPTREAERMWLRDAEVAEVALPVAPVPAGAVGQTAAFRSAFQAVETALGEPAVIGSYGSVGPYGRPVEGSGWGAPFVRWQGRWRAGSVELRAGRAGPELVLTPEGRWEFWVERLHYDGPELDGFYGSHPRAGVTLPAVVEVSGWDRWARTVGALLEVLPAEAAALGLVVNIPVYAFLQQDKTGPMLFDVRCDGRGDGRLFVGYYPPPGAAVAPFGWSAAAELPHTHPDLPGEEAPPLRVDAGGPGEVDGGAVGELLAATAQAAGVETAMNVVQGGEGEQVGRWPCRVTWYGLGARVA